MPDPVPDPAGMLEPASKYLPQVTAFLRDLVQVPSVNGVNNEASVAQRAAEECRRLGLDYQLLAAVPYRPNLLAGYGQGEQGFCLIAHLDTVAPGPSELWSHPPFAAEIAGSRLYGRGTADNKAGLACAVYTAALLRDAGLLKPEQGRVLIAGVVDEESGASSPHGMRFLLDGGYLPVAGAIYTYASDIICIGHRGLLRYQVTARGKAVHSGSAGWSRGEGGVNASTGLADVLLRLEGLFRGTGTHIAFPGMRSTITPGTLIHGGEFESMVPAYAEAMVDVRLLPGMTSTEVLEKTEQILHQVMEERPGLQLNLMVKNDLPAAMVPPDHRLVRIAGNITEAVTGQRWRAEGAGPANEGYMLIQKGIPTLCGFGPTGGNAHAPDEWVDLESLPVTIAMYAAILLDYLKPDREDG